MPSLSGGRSSGYTVRFAKKLIEMPWTSQDREIMRDIYLLVSKHPDPANNEEYWQSLIDHGQEICAKYDGHPLAVHFICSVFEYWEQVCNGSYDLTNKKVVDYSGKGQKNTKLEVA